MLAKHSYGLLDEVQETLRQLPGVHLSEIVEYKLLHEASRAGVSRAVLSVRVLAADVGTTRTVLPFAPLRRTSRSTLQTSTSAYAMRASIVSDSAWLGRVQRMPKYRGNAERHSCRYHRHGRHAFVEILSRIRRVI